MTVTFWKYATVLLSLFPLSCCALDMGAKDDSNAEAKYHLFFDQVLSSTHGLEGISLERRGEIAKELRAEPAVTVASSRKVLDRASEDISDTGSIAKIILALQFEYWASPESCESDLLDLAKKVSLRLEFVESAYSENPGELKRVVGENVYSKINRCILLCAQIFDFAKRNRIGTLINFASSGCERKGLFSECAVRYLLSFRSENDRVDAFLKSLYADKGSKWYGNSLLGGSPERPDK